MTEFDYEAQPKELIQSCNLCGWQQFEPYAARDRYGLPVRSEQCAGCGLVFLNPRMTPAAYRSFYGNGAYRGLLTQYYGKDVTVSMPAGQANYAQWLYWWLSPHLVGKKTLLDIGGSTGVVGTTLARPHALAVTVLEPSGAEGGAASSGGCEVVQGCIEDWSTDRQWDVVLLCQTIDHLTDITAALRTIRRLLAPGGVFYVDVADYRHHLLNSGSRELSVKVDHPFYLTPMLVETYLKRAGFKIVDKMSGPKLYQAGFVCEGKA